MTIQLQAKKRKILQTTVNKTPHKTKAIPHQQHV